MPRRWTRESILEMQRQYQPACVLLAAAELDLFTALGAARLSARDIAARIRGTLRATTMLLDALVALGVLRKKGDLYQAGRDVLAAMGGSARGNVLAMAQHQANCLRRWAELAAVVRSGRCAQRRPSIRGEAADYAAFIEAMDNVSAPMAMDVVRRIKPGRFAHLLDVGGASGSWTIAFLKGNRRSIATLFDLPRVMPQAKARLDAAGLSGRVRLVAGDYTTDALPGGADLAWVSAIVHSNGRDVNRALFRKIHAALRPGGRILLRDVVMDESRTQPPQGALFAINMLAGTEAGATFTLGELRDDLVSAGFQRVRGVVRDPGMNSVVEAHKST